MTANMNSYKYKYSNWYILKQVLTHMYIKTTKNTT